MWKSTAIKSNFVKITALVSLLGASSIVAAPVRCNVSNVSEYTLDLLCDSDNVKVGDIVMVYKWSDSTHSTIINKGEVVKKAGAQQFLVKREAGSLGTDKMEALVYPTKVVVLPPLTENQINNVLNAKFVKLNAVYNKFFRKHNNLKGQVEIGLTVGTDGKVKKTHIIKSSTNVAGFDDALMNAVKKHFKFPKFGGADLELTIPLDFGS